MYKRQVPPSGATKTRGALSWAASTWSCAAAAPTKTARSRRGRRSRSRPRLRRSMASCRRRRRSRRVKLYMLYGVDEVLFSKGGLVLLVSTWTRIRFLFPRFRQTEDPHHLKVNISTLANFASRRHFHDKFGIHRAIDSCQSIFL